MTDRAGQLFRAGIAPAGIDPVEALAPVAPAKPPRALRYDPATKRIVQNADGSFVDEHPVDQNVVLNWTIPKGSIPCAKDVGTDLTSIKSLGDRAIASKVDSAKRDAVKALIANGDIEVVSTLGEAPRDTPGRLLTMGTYKNLRLPKKR